MKTKMVWPRSKSKRREQIRMWLKEKYQIEDRRKLEKFIMEDLKQLIMVCWLRGGRSNH